MTRRPRRKSPGPRPSPRPRASRDQPCAARSASSRSPRTPCWRRASSGLRSSSSTRRSRCSSSRCGPGNVQDGFQQTWNWGIYPEAFQEYWPWIGRSIVYGGLATILAFALGFPLAYAIAFRGGAYKNLLLFLVIAPFFTSFLLRTLSWKIIFSDDGHLPRPAQDHRHHPGRFPAAGHAGRGHRRHHLQLPAVHDPAPVRRAREDRPAAARGGRGPVRRSVAAARDVRRGHPGRHCSASWSAWSWTTGRSSSASRG